MSQLKRRCIFCDGKLTGCRAKEHIIPAWLLQHLQITKDELLVGVARSSDNRILSRRRVPTGNFVEGRVCEKCNGGWMSNLESKAKSLVVQLIAGRQNLFALGNDDRTLFARWATKTAFVLRSAGVGGPEVNPAHLRVLAKVPNALPSQICVAAQHHRATRTFSYLSRNDWPEIAAVNVIGQINPITNSYKICFQLRDLLILVAHWPQKLSAYVLECGMHFPIWPLLNLYPSYYPRFGMRAGSDSIDVLQRFNLGLAVVHTDRPLHSQI